MNHGTVLVDESSTGIEKDHMFQSHIHCDFGLSCDQVLTGTHRAKKEMINKIDICFSFFVPARLQHSRRKKEVIATSCFSGGSLFL